MLAFFIKNWAYDSTYLVICETSSCIDHSNHFVLFNKRGGLLLLCQVLVDVDSLRDWLHFFSWLIAQCVLFDVLILYVDAGEEKLCVCFMICSLWNVLAFDLGMRRRFLGITIIDSTMHWSRFSYRWMMFLHKCIGIFFLMALWSNIVRWWH